LILRNLRIQTRESSDGRSGAFAEQIFEDRTGFAHDQISVTDDSSSAKGCKLEWSFQFSWRLFFDCYALAKR
jgi:hypothetical protein